MDPLTVGLIGSAISGGANLLGSMFSSNQSAANTQLQVEAAGVSQAEAQGFNADQAQLNRDWSAQQADINRQFQAGQVSQAEAYNQNMASTAYQRASADMQKAGLNPMMMFGSGGPSAVPASPTASGSMPSGSAASSGAIGVGPINTKSPWAGVGQAVDSAINSFVTAKTMDKMTNEIANLQAQRGLTTAATDTEAQRAHLVEQQRATEVERTKGTGAEADIKTLQIPAARFSAKSAEDLLSMPEWLRSAAVTSGFLGQKASDVVAPIANSAGAIRRFLPSRSTVERTNSSGDQTFEDRWDNMIGSYQR